MGKHDKTLAMTTKTINCDERCVYVSSPYQGYVGRAEYDRESGLFHGEVVGTKDVITFQAKVVDKLRRAFVDSVDDYLSFCKARGENPEKPFSGKFVVRISPTLHRQVSTLAEGAGKSLNTLVEQWLERMVTSTNQGSVKKAAGRKARGKKSAGRP
jgi:predicted HicB family RNase H-like nuclease